MMVNAIEIQAEKGDQEAEHGAAGVAHEDTSGRKVVGQKAETSAEQAPRARAAGADRGRRIHRGVPECNQGGSPAGDSVRTVKKVECVDEDRHEQARQDGVKNRMAEECQIPLGLAKKKS